MLAAVRSAAVLGVEAFDVTVEVDCSRGLPQWTVVGMAASSVKESRERVAAALANAGFALPNRRVTINLAPADTAKTGTAFDLPIAVAVLVAFNIVPVEHVKDVVFLGELGLDGNVRPVRGVLSVARRLARSERRETLVLPQANVAEASLVRDLTMCAPASISELATWLREGRLPHADRAANVTHHAELVDFADVVGQASAKRALEIAAAGGHNALLVGPPGAGKTMMARRLPSILPALTEEEALEVTAIHSVAGLINGTIPSALGRPFRAPHHSVSIAGLVGGGSTPRPGEVSLAHHGVLFLDELLEFSRHTLEALRQPLEDGRVMIARAASVVTYPARFSLIAAMNPCPCGYAGDSVRACQCSESDVHRYRSRLSGPLLDRIDLHVTLPRVAIRELGETNAGEGSLEIRRRVEQARAYQRARYACDSRVRCNAQASGRALVTQASTEARLLFETAAESLALSARAYHRVARVARTIADLDGSSRLEDRHVAEALRYRSYSGSSTREPSIDTNVPRAGPHPKRDGEAEKDRRSRANER